MMRTRLPIISARRILLCFVILVVEFAALEWGLRLYGGSEASPSFQSIFMDDPRVGHRLSPGARTRYTTVEFSTDIVINRQGVRDDRDIGPKATDERRVVVLGDSLVLSVQVRLAETFCKRLEARLATADSQHHWRVINAGVQGYGPVDDWFFFRNVAEAFQPDVVLIVAFVGNDAVEANDEEAWLDAGAPAIDESVDVALNRMRRLTRSSMVLQLARLRLDQLKAHFTGPGTERPLTTYLADPPREVTHGLEVARRAFGLIAARAAELGARTGIVLMPARFQTDDADYGRLAVIVREGGDELVRNSGTARFEQALAPLGLPILDLLPVLAAQPNREGLFFQRNVHLTPRGHDVVAEALFRFLEDNRLMSRVQRP
jgi:hypothetical protein